MHYNHIVYIVIVCKIIELYSCTYLSLYAYHIKNMPV